MPNYREDFQYQTDFTVKKVYLLQNTSVISKNSFSENELYLEVWS